MGKRKGPYNEEFPLGSLVRIADREVLEHFMRTWKYHNKLEPQQLDYAGRTGRIMWFGFYHGGDELYEIEGVPGIWHEECLASVNEG